MIMLGLTGSIGMGKSATAAMFAEAGCPVYDADAEVHRLYAKGGAAVGPVGEAFPGVVEDGAVNRAKLSDLVVGKPDQLDRLNRTVWPLMGANRRDFLAKAEADGVDIVVFDIPLLFETGGERNMDAVVVVSAPGRGAAPARPGPRRHERSQAGRDSGAADGRCRQARQG